jgi:hypothetical protein
MDEFFCQQTVPGISFLMLIRPVSLAGSLTVRKPGGNNGHFEPHKVRNAKPCPSNLPR